MKYNFKEGQLSDDFCAERLSDIKKLLNPSGFFTIVGIPGVGISFFIRFLATRSFAHFVYLDVASLAFATKREFYVVLLRELGVKHIPVGEQEMLEEAKKQLSKLTKDQHVIFLFNRFDELGKAIDKTLLGSLRTLRHGAADRISMIFVSHQPLVDISEEVLSGGNMDMFSNIYYFKPYGEDDLEKLFYLHSPELIGAKKYSHEIWETSGGHYALAKLLCKAKENRSVADRFIKFSLKKIYASLSYQNKKILQKIAFARPIKEISTELYDLGLIKDENGKNSLFSSLFVDYIRTSTAIKLPVKESKLFQLLKKRLDTVVTKEEIFKTLWSEDEDEYGSDWALNSLIYRLRKNPIFSAKGYIIENYKKSGYLLVKE